MQNWNLPDNSRSALQRRQEFITWQVQNITPAEEKAFKECMRSGTTWYKTLPVVGVLGYVGYQMGTTLSKPQLAPLLGGFCSVVGLAISKYINSQGCMYKSMPYLAPMLKADKLVLRKPEPGESMEGMVNNAMQMDFSQFDPEPDQSYETYAENKYESGMSNFEDNIDEVASDINDVPETASRRTNLTYDDLRRKNRDDYRKKLERQVSQSVPQQRQPQVRRPAPQTDSEEQQDLERDYWR